MKNVLSSIKIHVIGCILLLTLASCNQSSTKEAAGIKNPLQQRKNELLNGVVRAISYSGYREDQSPDKNIYPSYDEILEDLKILEKDGNFPLIRIYDSGVNAETVLQVISENNINIAVMLGVWLRAEVSNHEGCAWLTEPIAPEVLAANKEFNLAELNRGITLANQYSDIVVAVNVGNEALVDWADHEVSVDTIISYVKNVQDAIEQPVTVADNYKWWAESGKSLAKAVDFVSIHVYPVWEGQDIDNAMEFTINNVKEVKDSLPESTLVITEAGWATVGSEFGERASEEKQVQYYTDLYNWAEEMNITTFFFEAFDEPWKGDVNNPDGAEKHWGIFTVKRKPKLVMKELYPEL